MKTLLMITLLNVVSCIATVAQTPPADDVSAIRATEEIFRTAWLKNDEQTIMSLFTSDAALYPGGGEPQRGIDALRKYWFGPSDVTTSIDRFQVSIEEVHGTPVFATVTGSDVIDWSTVKKDGTDRKRFVSKGHFLAVYKKDNGRWRILKRFAAAKTEEVKGAKS
jgi:ketosteroid isomerase-like protein